VLQSPLNLSDDHLDGDRVVPAARNYHVGVTLARLYELKMHRLDGGQVLLDDFVERPPTNVGVALDPANEPDVRIRIDEHLDVAKIPHAVVDEQQDSVDDDDVGRLHSRWLRTTEMRHEVILRFVDRLTLAERLEMGAKQVVVERVGVVPIELPALVQGEGSEILVVRVHVDERDRRRREMIRDIPGHGRFSRARAAGDSDNQRFEHPAPKLRLPWLERIMPR